MMKLISHLASGCEHFTSCFSTPPYSLISADDEIQPEEPSKRDAGHIKEFHLVTRGIIAGALGLILPLIVAAYTFQCREDLLLYRFASLQDTV
jgi:hypothetical protein